MQHLDRDPLISPGSIEAILVGSGENGYPCRLGPTVPVTPGNGFVVHSPTASVRGAGERVASLRTGVSGAAPTGTETGTDLAMCGTETGIETGIETGVETGTEMASGIGA